VNEDDIRNALKTSYAIVEEVLPMLDHAAVIRGSQNATDRMGLRRAALPVVFAALTSEDGTSQDHEFMSVREVANLLSTSAGTVYRLINSGDLEAIRVTPNLFRVKSESVRRYKR
jgi:excisionase family DNA binding protein